MGKTNRMPARQESEGVNYGKIKRNLMMRDTGGDLSRFKQQTVTPKTKKKDKYQNWKNWHPGDSDGDE